MYIYIYHIILLFIYTVNYTWNYTWMHEHIDFTSHSGFASVVKSKTLKSQFLISKW